jgi:hypothetical protein
MTKPRTPAHRIDDFQSSDIASNRHRHHQAQRHGSVLLRRIDSHHGIGNILFPRIRIERRRCAASLSTTASSTAYRPFPAATKAATRQQLLPRRTLAAPASIDSMALPLRPVPSTVAHVCGSDPPAHPPLSDRISSFFLRFERWAAPRPGVLHWRMPQTAQLGSSL